MFADLIRRLQPEIQNGHVSLIKLIEAAKTMSRDGERLAQLYQDICKHQSPVPKEDIFRHRRTFHFRRLVVHYFMLIGDKKQQIDHPISRHSLLQWYDVLEIALGRDYFAQPHQICADIVNELKQHPNFAYQDFLQHPRAMMEYAILMTRLAVFIEVNPKKRIEWLVNAMASNPSTHMINGLPVHIKESAPPTFSQIKALIIGVFSYIFQYIQQHHLEDDIQARLGVLKLPPKTLFNHLLVHIESLVQD